MPVPRPPTEAARRGADCAAAGHHPEGMVRPGDEWTGLVRPAMPSRGRPMLDPYQGRPSGGCLQRARASRSGDRTGQIPHSRVGPVGNRVSSGPIVTSAFRARIDCPRALQRDAGCPIQPIDGRRRKETDQERRPSDQRYPPASLALPSSAAPSHLTTPRCNNTTRSAMARARSMYCSTRRMVTPCSRATLSDS